MTAVVPTQAPAEDLAESTLHILDNTGDTVLKWRKDNATEMAVAKAAFKAALDKNAGIYKVSKSGSRTRIFSFDEDAEEIKIIAVPQMMGG
jgi:aminoglycoside/choline kinase family phosphotransferase